MSLSRASLVDIDDLISLNEADFRQRFEIAFKLDPTLTATKFYQNLVEADFDEQKAVLRLRLSLARLRNPSEFPIPRFLAPQAAITSTSSIPTPTKGNASETQSAFSPQKPTIQGVLRSGLPHIVKLWTRTMSLLFQYVLNQKVLGRLYHLLKGVHIKFQMLLRITLLITI